MSQLIKWEANYHYHLYMYFVHQVHLMRFFPKHTTSVHIFLIYTITDLWQVTDVAVYLTLLLSCAKGVYLSLQEEMFLSIRTPEEDPLDSSGFLRGSLFDNTEQSSLEIPELIFNAEEFLRAHNETLALRRYGAFFADYLYTMDIEPEKDPDAASNDQVDGLEVVGEIRLVKELSFKRIIVGPTHLQLSSSMVHKLELVSKLSCEDLIPRKGENIIFLCVLF